MKKISKIFTVVLCVILSLNVSYLVQANEVQYSSVPTIGNPSADLTSSRAYSYTLTRQSPGITESSCFINLIGTSVIMEAFTLATHVSTQIGNPVVRLQKWDGYTWTNVYTALSSYSYDSASCTKFFSYTAQKGDYLRFSTDHLAVINGVTYKGSCYTDYVQVQ